MPMMINFWSAFLGAMVGTVLGHWLLVDHPVALLSVFGIAAVLGTAYITVKLMVENDL